MRISKKIFSSLRWKIAFTYLIIIGIGFFVINISIMEILEQDMIDNKRTAYQKYAIQTAQLITVGYNPKHPYVGSIIRELGDEFTLKENEPTRILVLDKQGVVIQDSYNDLGYSQLLRKNLQGELPEISRVLSGEFIPAVDIYANVGTPPARGRILYAFAPITHHKEGVIGVVVLSTSLKSVETVLSDIQRVLNIYIALISISITLISLTLSGFITQPIKDLTASIEKMSKGHLSQRIHIRGNDELNRLGEAFNIMSEKLENLDKARNNFVSNASHELKTPLSAIKVLTESLLHMDSQEPEIYKEFLGDINNEIDRLNAIISDLLELVHIDNDNMVLDKKPVLLNELILKTVKGLQLIAEKRDIKIETKLLEDVEILGNDKQLRQVITNIVDNGIKYTPDGGIVTVELFKQASAAFIKISDTGVGIPKEEITHIFDRFYRVDKARSRATGGTGLGLSIAQQIVFLHNGTIDVESVEGEGTTFTIELPI